MYDKTFQKSQKSFCGFPVDFSHSFFHKTQRELPHQPLSCADNSSVKWFVGGYGATVQMDGIGSTYLTAISLSGGPDSQMDNPPAGRSPKGSTSPYRTARGQMLGQGSSSQRTQEDFHCYLLLHEQGTLFTLKQRSHHTKNGKTETNGEHDLAT